VKDEELRQAGLKVTLPRLNILKVLESAKSRHMSAEEVYQKLTEQGEDVSLATVYRVLTQFEAAGLVQRHHFEGGHSVFELDQGEHHDHLVCLQCAAVEEFVDELIEARQAVVAKRSGFQMTDHSLTIYGICERCQKSSA